MPRVWRYCAKPLGSVALGHAAPVRRPDGDARLLGDRRRWGLLAGGSPLRIQTFPRRRAGSGQTVAIVDAFDDPNAESDLATYRSHYGLPACTTASGCFGVSVTRAGQFHPAANAGWALEISPHPDMASAACPNCHIVLVDSTNSFTNLLPPRTRPRRSERQRSATAGRVKSSPTRPLRSHFRHPGVPITVSAGDSGYGPIPWCLAVRDRGGWDTSLPGEQRSRWTGRPERHGKRLQRV